MRLRPRRVKETPAATLYLPDGDELVIPHSQIAVAGHLLNELSILRNTVTDLNTRLMQIEGDEYEDNDD